jgi:hypothetical protein
MINSKTDKEKPEVIICNCFSSEHQMILRYCDNSDEMMEDEIYVDIHLITHKSFWKRLIAGIRYIFGHTSKYGDWDEMILTGSEISQLRDYLNKLDIKNGKRNIIQG